MCKPFGGNIRRFASDHFFDLMVEITMMIANPLAALAVGIVLDQISDWLFDHVEGCKEE